VSKNIRLNLLTMESNRPHPRYSKVYLAADWLEQFILDELSFKQDVLFSKSEFAADRKVKAFVFYMLHKYGGLNATRISERYGQSPQYVERLYHWAKNGDWAWERLIEGLLEPYLPITQNEIIRINGINK
jgi:hypothetical protein